MIAGLMLALAILGLVREVSLRSEAERARNEAEIEASKAIGEGLVSDGVANSPDDVNGVLTNGFFYLYGPINDYTG